ncbi:hypothetical protein ACSMXN_05265 [Jatrophihabitans sp. DSM 45814]
MGAIIGMDPHKRSATIEVIDVRGGVLSEGSWVTRASAPVSVNVSVIDVRADRQPQIVDCFRRIVPSASGRLMADRHTSAASMP